jgi:hypothetical protein
MLTGEGRPVIEQQGSAAARLIGLSIEPDFEHPHRQVLKLGTSRFECILELDHPDFTIDGGHLGPLFTLDCWISELERLSRGGGPVVLLPFNFSDQCTGWLRVTLLPESFVEVQAGWSGVSQYELAPTDLVAGRTSTRRRHPGESRPQRHERARHRSAAVS